MSNWWAPEPIIFSDEEANTMMEESAPTLVADIQKMLEVGESVEELEKWAREYITHKFNSPVIGELFIQVIHYLSSVRV